jgi:hypothetical protein
MLTTLHAADVQPPSAFDNSDGYYEGLTVGNNEGETKQGSVAQSPNYSNDDDYQQGQY